MNHATNAIDHALHAWRRVQERRALLPEQIPSVNFLSHYWRCELNSREWAAFNWDIEQFRTAMMGAVEKEESYERARACND